MKKNILALLLILSLMASLVQFTVYASMDPYSTIQASSFDENISLHTRDNFAVSASRVSAIWKGDYLGYKDLDFGKIGPNSVSVTSGAREGFATMVELRIDKPDGELIASVPITQVNFQTGITNTVEIKKKITGIHDLYITYNTQTADLFNFCFYTEEPDKFVYNSFVINEAYSDMGNDSKGHAANLLWQLGIMNGEKGKALDPSMPVSRGEFADAIYGIYKSRASGNTNEDGSAGVNTSFVDVPVDYPYSAAISHLTEIGVINGFGSTEFRPHEYIKYVDAVTILVRMLDYTEIVERKGGYPTFYLQKANELGLLSGDIDANDFLRRDVMATLIYRALQAKYLGIVGVYEPDRISYELLSDVLEKTQNVYNGVGVVTATEISALNMPKSGVGRDIVQINGEFYKTGKTSAIGFLGVECEFYYELQKNGDKVLRAIAPNRNIDITEISSKDDEIYEIKDSEISYYSAQKNKEEIIKINRNDNVIYNGVAADDSIENLIAHKENFTGTIRIVQNNDDSQTIIIDEYADYIIESIDYLSNTIVGKNETGTIKLDDDDLYVIYDDAMNDLLFKKLQNGDLITVYQSKNKSGTIFSRVYLSKKSILGTVTSTEDNNLYINDKKYRKSNNCTDILKAGTQGIYIQNIYGDIVALGEDSDNSLLVGLFMAHSGQPLGLKDEIKIKIMTTEGKTCVYNTAKNVTIDGVKLSGANEILNGKSTWIGLSNFTAETAIRYRLNSNNEILLIDTPIASTNDGSYTNRLTCLNENDTRRYGYYRNTGMVFAREGNGPISYYLAPDSLVFSFFGLDNREGNCRVDQAKNILIESGYQMFGRFYSTVGEEKYCPDLFVWNDSIEHLSFEGPFVVKNITNGVDAEGNPTKMIHGIYGGRSMSYVLHEDATTIANASDSDEKKAEKKATFQKNIANIKTGDILIFELLPANTVRAGRLMLLRDGTSKRDAVGGGVIEPAINKDVRSSGSSGNVETRYVFGPIIKKTDKYIVIDAGNGVEEVINIENGSVTIVGSDSEQTYKIKGGLSSTHLTVGDAAFVYIDSGVTHSIIVYKNITF